MQSKVSNFVDIINKVFDVEMFKHKTNMHTVKIVIEKTSPSSATYSQRVE